MRSDATPANEVRAAAVRDRVKRYADANDFTAVERSELELVLNSGRPLEQALDIAAGQGRHTREFLERIFKGAIDDLARLAPGGIDFRMIPMITQPMGTLSGLSVSLPKLSNVESINLDEELNQIRKMLAAGITPSGERLKEYVAACYQKGELKAYVDGIVGCLVDICKLEEQNVEQTPNAVKELLLVMDSTG
jgi:hypothetical protein